MPGITPVKTRRGTASLWTTTNPVLSDGEMGLESDTGKVKFGNGVATWTALSYAIPGGTGLQTLDPPGAWATYKKAVANQANQTLKWWALGNSITEGTGVTTRQQTWPYLVAKKFREAYPSIAGNVVTTSTGWSPILQTSTTLPSTWTVTGTYTSTNLFGFRFTKGVALNPGGTITGTVVGTAIDIWFPKGTATGNFTVKVDGVQIGGTYGGTAASTTDGFVQRVSLGAAGSHAIIITSTHATNPQYFTGITVFNGNEGSGIVNINGGYHGATSDTFAVAAANPNWVQNITALDPHLVTIELGANDYTALVGPDTYEANIRGLVETIRTYSTTYPSICLIATYKRSEVASPKWEYYEYRLQQLAYDMGCGFIDLRDTMPDVGSTAAVNGGYYADTVHPTATGNTWIADQVAKVLTNPSYGTVSPPPDPAPVGHIHANATTVDPGFMSAADKLKLDSAASGLTPSVLVIRDTNSNFSSGSPSAAAHVATKGYVDSVVSGGGASGLILGDNGRNYRMIACVVRNTGSGFQFIDDATHTPAGVTSISTAADQLSFTINYNFTAVAVGSLVATPDETLAREGYIMGGSVGLTSSTFQVGQPGGWGDYVSYNGTAWTSLNGFVTATSMNTTTGLITMTHEDMVPVSGQVNCRSFGYRAAMSSLGSTSTAVYLVNNSGVSLKTPNSTDCQFFVTRAGSRQVKMNELTLANSNIWIAGFMEV